MAIRRTYARLWADDLDSSLPLLRELTGAEPDLRFAFAELELAAIGDFLVIAAPPEVRARYANASATVVVDDLDALAGKLDAHGATVIVAEASSDTGRFLYARHPGGAEVEYVQWNEELARRVLGDNR
ncbi:glyoxalase [Amycolatopsis antarctica]|uniref:Glyoxalase n=1 Tax=Amycolatopsis antarctica TaxID=1854586 RepID=A0A263D5W9_9PSEU|nr:VOC family protein [Amycolatopsis antarctica]OZM72795.1 glyoxalase [Amycolatopsis antarctica]